MTKLVNSASFPPAFPGTFSSSNVSTCICEICAPLNLQNITVNFTVNMAAGRKLRYRVCSPDFLSSAPLHLPAVDERSCYNMNLQRWEASAARSVIDAPELEHPPSPALIFTSPGTVGPGRPPAGGRSLGRQLRRWELWYQRHKGPLGGGGRGGGGGGPPEAGRYTVPLLLLHLQ